jgi:hypothetical protein
MRLKCMGMQTIQRTKAAPGFQAGAANL